MYRQVLDDILLSYGARNEGGLNSSIVKSIFSWLFSKLFSFR